MSGYVLSPQSQDEIFEIWSYLAVETNIEFADHDCGVGWPLERRLQPRLAARHSSRAATKRTLDKPPVCPEQAGGMFNEEPQAIDVNEEFFEAGEDLDSL